MTEEEELAIIVRVVNGETACFAALVDHYKDMAILLAYNILLNQEDAEEAAQDAFLRACNHLSFFQARSKFSTWLYRIVINTA